MKRSITLCALGLGLIAVSAPAAPGSSAADSSRVLVVYYSNTGNTATLATAVAEGAREIGGTSVSLKSVDEVGREDLMDADGIVLGSPTYYANMAGPMKKFIDDWALGYGVYLKDKVGGAFATGDGMTGGKEHVVVSLLLAMMGSGMVIVGPVYDVAGVEFGYFGASAVTASPYEGVADDEMEDARKLGRRVAEIAHRMRSTEE